jgi:hypothetical protein
MFKEAALPAGLDIVDCSHSAAFCDYDGDGRLDMYLLTNRIEDPAGTPTEMPIINTRTGRFRSSRKPSSITRLALRLRQLGHRSDWDARPPFPQ